jgi:hypothetical protein
MICKSQLRIHYALEKDDISSMNFQTRNKFIANW